MLKRLYAYLSPHLCRVFNQECFPSFLKVLYFHLYLSLCSAGRIRFILICYIHNMYQWRINLTTILEKQRQAKCVVMLHIIFFAFFYVTVGAHQVGNVIFYCDAQSRDTKQLLVFFVHKRLKNWGDTPWWRPSNVRWRKTGAQQTVLIDSWCHYPPWIGVKAAEHYAADLKPLESRGELILSHDFILWG